MSGQTSVPGSERKDYQVKQETYPAPVEDDLEIVDVQTEDEFPLTSGDHVERRVEGLPLPPKEQLTTSGFSDTLISSSTRNDLDAIPDQRQHLGTTATESLRRMGGKQCEAV